MVLIMRQFLLVLIAFAFIGGTSFQRARATAYAAPMMMADMPCSMAMTHAGMQGDEPPLPSNGPPCKGMTSDCKQTCCVTGAALPARTMNLDLAVKFTNVDYWAVWSQQADFVREPEPLPPRTI